MKRDGAVVVASFRRTTLLGRQGVWPNSKLKAPLVKDVAIHTSVCRATNQTIALVLVRRGQHPLAPKGFQVTRS